MTFKRVSRCPQSSRLMNRGRWRGGQCPRDSMRLDIQENVQVSTGPVSLMNRGVGEEEGGEAHDQEIP